MGENKRKKLIALAITTVAIITIILSAGEIYLRKIGLLKIGKLYTKPNSFFLPDSIVGWKPRAGLYSFYSTDSSVLFAATINKDRNRITSFLPEGDSDTKRPDIQVYGCSYTFGFSMPDSMTQCFLIQTLLPVYRIENKGVPAYSLSQMFLLLQQSLGNGDTPKIAVFNYADFQDMRVPFNKLWCCDIWWFVESNIANHEESRFPYYSFGTEGIRLNYLPFCKLDPWWPLANESATVHLANYLWHSRENRNLQKELHTLAHKTSLEIMKYCDANHIVPIFASITNSGQVMPTTDIEDDLSKRGYITLNYGIDIGDSKYNCALDPHHPNALAHSIYADMLYQSLVNKAFDRVRASQ